MTRTISFLLVMAAGLVFPKPSALGKEVPEPAQTLPVLHEVDVVVVGGSSGGVAAAVAAARSGAKVFLAAPRPYLGEDICATYRLWLEPGEQPLTELAREVFKAPAPPPAPVAAGLPFTYTADVPSAAQHKDTQPPARLKDGKWSSAPKDSVQYDGEVTLQLDLGRDEEVRKINVMAYQRNDDFEVSQVTVSASADRQQWRQVALLKNDRLGQGAYEEASLVLSAPLALKTRYLKLQVEKGPQARRVLLGEVVVEGGTLTPPPPPATPPAPLPRPVPPMQVKRALDQALLQAKVPFLYASYGTELLRDARGQLAGVVIANRSGRQAVLAKVIIDATERAMLARLAQAEFTPYPTETQIFARTVVGGAPRAGDTLTLRKRATPMTIADRKGEAFPVLEYLVQIPLRDASFGALADAEQLARDLTWTKESVDASETLFQVPPETFRARQQQAGAWPGADKVPLEVFQPAGLERLFALGGCAAVSREAAMELVRPVNLMAVGERVGQAAAKLAASVPKLEGIKLAGAPVKDPVKGMVREVASQGVRPATPLAIAAEARGLPVLGEYEVVVVGGGTGGAPAGIGAGRRGAKTLLLEYLHSLGGVGTAGLISTYYHGNRVGFTREVDEGLGVMGGKDTRPSGSSWNPEWKIEWYRRELRQAGVDLWYGALGAGAVVDNGRVTGVAVLTPQGRGVVLAKVVVDATGNADIAAAAGATCRYTDDADLAVQGTGLPPKELGARYTNTDYTFVDDTDILDIWRIFVTARQKFKGAYDLGQLIDTRERRQIVGDLFLTPMDMILGRTHPDTIVIAKSNFDSHGYTVHPMFLVRPPHRDDLAVRVPYRCLLPRGLDGVLVTGLGVSAHRDAIPVIRMQPDVQNQGYAAGVAAAMIARQGGSTRALDIKALQKHLVEKGNLPESVLTETDSFPLPMARMADAVTRVVKDYDGLEVLLTDPDAAKPLLRQALASAPSDKEKLVYAHILGMLGDASGVDALVAAVKAARWDKGWRYTGMGQFGASLSPLDSCLVALGRTRDKKALAPLIEKVSQLEPNSEFSHFRAVALALEALADPAAARPLADLLQKPGLSGHAATTIELALKSNPASGTDVSTRNQALTEIYLARALYRCGDDQGLGEKILRQYAQDLHGHYARHAQAVLSRRPANP